MLHMHRKLQDGRMKVLLDRPICFRLLALADYMHFSCSICAILLAMVGRYITSGCDIFRWPTISLAPSGRNAALIPLLVEYGAKPWSIPARPPLWRPHAAVSRPSCSPPTLILHNFMFPQTCQCRSYIQGPLEGSCNKPQDDMKSRML
jgi:hypothetical protein